MLSANAFWDIYAYEVRGFRNLQDSDVFSMPYSTTYVCCDNEKVQATFHKHSTGGGIDPTILKDLVVFYSYWQILTAK
jgi:hypothetical protein